MLAQPLSKSSLAISDVTSPVNLVGKIRTLNSHAKRFFGTTLQRSALVYIRRKALLSSVGFRKRMTSRSPRGISCMVLHRS